MLLSRELEGRDLVGITRYDKGTGEEGGKRWKKSATQAPLKKTGEKERIAEGRPSRLKGKRGRGSGKDGRTSSCNEKRKKLGKRKGGGRPAGISRENTHDRISQDNLIEFPRGQ